MVLRVIFVIIYWSVTFATVRAFAINIEDKYTNPLIPRAVLL